MSKRKKMEQEQESLPLAPVPKKARVESRKKRPGITQDIYSETTYYIRNGLRHVEPYYFTFTTHAKGRWVGSKVVDVFCREFQSETPEYYEKAIKAGKVTVNGVVATMDTVVKDNELVTHRVHRHEPPVTATPLNIIHQDEDLVILDKPASIPVHPCGRYRHNSVVFLMAREHNLLNLHTIHRLDRLTSGLLMFARSVSKAQRMESEIRERRVSKVYVCRVEGEFPSESVECSEPILVVTHKVGVCRVDPRGKECSTKFTRLSYNGSSSVVKCEPRTGRMHQIRVHLQWLGHPIVNDPIYNHPAWKQTPPDSSVGDQSNIERVISEIVRTNYSSELEGIARKPLTGTASAKDSDTLATHDVEEAIDSSHRQHQATSTITEQKPRSDTETCTEDLASSDTLTTHDARQTFPGLCTCEPAEQVSDSHCITSSTANSVTSSEQAQTVLPFSESPVTVSSTDDDDGVSEERFEQSASLASCVENIESEDMTVDPDCSECKLDRPDPSPSDLLIFLHALSYKGDGWEFSTPLPNWAQPDWNGDKRHELVSTKPG